VIYYLFLTESGIMAVGYYPTVFLVYLNICLNPFIYATKHEGVKRQLAGLMALCRKRNEAAMMSNEAKHSRPSWSRVSFSRPTETDILAAKPTEANIFLASRPTETDILASRPTETDILQGCRGDGILSPYPYPWRSSYPRQT